MQLAKSAAKERGICITTLTALELVDQFIGKWPTEMHRPVRSSVSNAAKNLFQRFAQLKMHRDNSRKEKQIVDLPS